MLNTNVKRLTDYRPAPVIPIPTPPKPRLLDQVRQAMRTRHLSPKTEEAYIGWIKRFIFFHGKRHPLEMGEAEIGNFLSSLACDSHVAPRRKTRR